MTRITTNHLRLPIMAVAFLAGQAAFAFEPSLQPGDIYTYKAKKKYVQRYVGQDVNGNHVWKIGRKQFLASKEMSTISTTTGTKVSPHNGQLMLNKSKRPGAEQVGHTWEIDYRVTKRGKTSQKNRKCELKAFKPKEVKAGLFDAYQVDCVIRTKGKKSRSYTSTWYDADSWKIIVHSSGRKGKLRKKSELVQVKRK